MKEKVRLGYIGCGRRGNAMLRSCFAQMDDVEIVALCDWSEDNLKTALDLLKEHGKTVSYTTVDYHDLMKDDSIDAIIIMSGWNTHVELATASVLAGKYTAVEVGCAYTLQECHDLIAAYEKTKAPLMMLENCCYGRREMMVLNLVKQGILGEIVHCKGGYLHYLPQVELFGDFNTEGADQTRQVNHYRLSEYINRNCENYPTHELGPICKVLGINRGNRLVKLTSTASKSRGLKTYVAEHLPADSPYHQVAFHQGDIINTCITCANGETILLTLDTTLPRPYYSRDFTVRGTKGMYTEERKVLFLEGMDEPCENNEAEAYEKYDHPLHAEYVRLGEKGGHDGMDWLVCRAFIESVKKGTNTPIDAYDTVTWMSIAALSEMSIQRGGVPVDVPDFTRGKWFRREPVVRSKFCLDEICEDKETAIY